MEIRPSCQHPEEINLQEVKNEPFREIKRTFKELKEKLERMSKSEFHKKSMTIHDMLITVFCKRYYANLHIRYQEVGQMAKAEAERASKKLVVSPYGKGFRLNMGELQVVMSRNERRSSSKNKVISKMYIRKTILSCSNSHLNKLLQHLSAL